MGNGLGGGADRGGFLLLLSDMLGINLMTAGCMGAWCEDVIVFVILVVYG